MNPELIKFIELCLIDGVISEKEREVIFRKSKELGVPEDECEIILDGMCNKMRVSDNTIKPPNEIKKITNNNGILELDTSVLLKYSQFLRSINSRLSWIEKNKIEDNNEFVNWLSSIENKIETKICSEYNEKYICINTVPDLGQFRPGSLDRFIIDNSISVRYENTIGIIKSSEFQEHDCDYLLTNKSLYPLIYQKSGFFGKPVLTFDIPNRISISKINFEEKKIQSILRKFIVCYFNTPNKFSILDILSGFQNDIEFDSTEDHLISCNDTDIKLVIKTNSEIQKIHKNIQRYIRYLCDLDYQSELDFELRVLGKNKRGWNEDYGVVEKVYDNLEILLDQIQLLTTVILLRNSLILFLKEDNSLKKIDVIEKLDGLGIFMNYFEKKSLDELQKIRSEINSGISDLKGILFDIQSEVSFGFNKVGDKLNDINSSLEFNNLISVIGTYQLYRIRKEIS